MQEDRRGWHVDKTLSVGHMITTITVAASVVIFIAKLDTRISLVEQQMLTQLEVNKKHELQDEALSRTIREELREVNSRLERMLVLQTEMAARSGIPVSGNGKRGP